MADACAKCGVPLPKLDRGPPQRLCSKCRAPTLMGVAAPELVKQLAELGTKRAAPPVPAPVDEPSSPAEPPGGAAADDDPERSSVLSDLRAISAQATAASAPGTDEPDPVPVADDQPLPSPPPEAPPTAPEPTPPPGAPSAVHDQCPRCGFALPPRPGEAASSAAPGWLPPPVRRFLAHRHVRTFLPWAIAACSLLVAIIVTVRGARAPSSDQAAASASADAAGTSADEPGSRPPPRVPPPGLGPRPKPAPTKSAPAKPTPKK